jgi:hypothetical protein
MVRAFERRSITSAGRLSGIEHLLEGLLGRCVNFARRSCPAGPTSTSDRAVPLTELPNGLSRGTAARDARDPSRLGEDALDERPPGRDGLSIARCPRVGRLPPRAIRALRGRDPDSDPAGRFPRIASPSTSHHRPIMRIEGGTLSHPLPRPTPKKIAADPLRRHHAVQLSRAGVVGSPKHGAPRPHELRTAGGRRHDDRASDDPNTRRVASLLIVAIDAQAAVNTEGLVLKTAFRGDLERRFTFLGTFKYTEKHNDGRYVADCEAAVQAHWDPSDETRPDRRSWRRGPKGAEV